MNKGFSNLAELFREKNDTAYENNASVAALSESESDDCGSRSDVQPAPKKKKKKGEALFCIRTIVIYLINRKGV